MYREIGTYTAHLPVGIQNMHGIILLYNGSHCYHTEFGDDFHEFRTAGKKNHLHFKRSDIPLVVFVAFIEIREGRHTKVGFVAWRHNGPSKSLAKLGGVYNHNQIMHNMVKGQLVWLQKCALDAIQMSMNWKWIKMLWNVSLCLLSIDKPWQPIVERTHTMDGWARAFEYSDRFHLRVDLLGFSIDFVSLDSPPTSIFYGSLWW